MSCASCARSVEKALKSAPGVVEASVNFASGKALVDYDKEITSPAKLTAVVEKAGYRVEYPAETAVFKVHGMTCASCALTIEGVIKDITGVGSASLNFSSEKAFVTYDPELVTLSEIITEVESAGYRLTPAGAAPREEESAETAALEEARRRARSAWKLTVLLMLIMALHRWFMVPGVSDATLGVLTAALALAVITVPGHKTLKSAFISARRFNANMDVLIALGAASAFFLGVASFFFPVENFAGVAAMVMTFHISGRYLEAKARGRASEAIRKLIKIGTKNARVITDKGEKEIPVEELVPGDVFSVKPGERIPTDGVILKGVSAIDESLATGEPIPKDRGEGDRVIGSTINRTGLLHIKAEKVGKDTFLSQVVRLVEEAQSTRIPVQEFADMVTARFVPAVLAVSALTFAAWLVFPGFFMNIATDLSAFLPWVNPEIGTLSMAVFASVTVLVIACPCALGLATPTALMVGAAMGAENGILIRKGRAIQVLKDADTVVFDKTGTLTEGKPRVAEVIPVDMSVDELLFLAASVESGSEHPLAGAVVMAAEEKRVGYLTPDDFKSSAGMGAAGTVKGERVKVGSSRYIGEASKDGIVKELYENLQERGMTSILVAVEGKPAGVIGISDALKESSSETVKELKRMGLGCAMITGDNSVTAAAVASAAGISSVLSEVLPQDKDDEIRRLQEDGNIVIMVGDGINDAPALARADCGIAVGTGTDIAIESADVTLVSGNLEGVVRAVRLSRATFRKIKQNLGWAYGYNIIAIPVAVLGLLHPVIGVTAMTLSSVSVVTNARLLRRARF